jgi:hypothetical protein
MNDSFGSGPPYESKTHPTTSFAKNEVSKIPFLLPNHRTQVKSAVLVRTSQTNARGKASKLGR